MSTARRLTIVVLVSCCLSAGFVVSPTLAQGDVQFRGTQDLPVHPIFGAITDDPGPFRILNWGSTVTNQYYLPQEENPDEGSGPDTPPEVQFNPVSGYPIAIWAETGTPGAGSTGPGDVQADTRADILVTYFTVGGWRAPVLLAADGADPKLAIDPQSGRVHLVYWTPADGAVWHRQAPADLSSWTEPIRVSDRREVAGRPVLLIVEGRVHVAYESHLLGLGSTPREVVLAELSEGGVQRQGLALTTHPGAIWLRLDSDGKRLLVRWLDDDHHAGWILRDEFGDWGDVVRLPTGIAGRAAAESGRSAKRR